MLFIICGSLADPKRAVVLEEEFAEDWLGASLQTIAAESGQTEPHESHGQEEAPQMGVTRIGADGTFPADAALHILPMTTSGTTIGSGSCNITDVGPHVSRKHARIYYEGGHWYLVGLKSTNGTTVISSAGDDEKVVEPPKPERKRKYEPEPVEIGAADTICLADDTRFVVRRVS